MLCPLPCLVGQVRSRAPHALEPCERGGWPSYDARIRTLSFGLHSRPFVLVSGCNANSGSRGDRYGKRICCQKICSQRRQNRSIHYVEPSDEESGEHHLRREGEWQDPQVSAVRNSGRKVRERKLHVAGTCHDGFEEVTHSCCLKQNFLR